MNTPAQDKKIAVMACAGLWLLVTAATWYCRDLPGAGLLPVILSAGILLAGYSFGPLGGWIMGAVSGLSVLTFMLVRPQSPVEAQIQVQALISLPHGLLCLAIFVTSALYPLPWFVRQEKGNNRFFSASSPLKEARDLALSQLEKSKKEVEEAKERSKESDSLYHVSREINKVLTLGQMMELGKEVLGEALKKRRHRESLRLKDSARFLLLLVDAEQKRFKVGASSEGEADAAKEAETQLGAADFINWLYTEAKPLNIPDVHEDLRLRVLQAPWMMKSLISIPMMIRSEVIGMILIYDMVPNAFDKQDFDNFLVLGNQIVIGVEKAALYEKVQYLSITDGLTGLTVHRFLQERLDEEIRRAVRYSQPLAFVMMDIDFFKKYNDIYGHLAGDEVLKCVARILAKAAEGSGIVSRYGGEEFALVLPNQTKEAALEKAEKIRAQVEAEKLIFEGQSTTVTISCGVAGFPEDAMTKKGLIDRADQALYQAKASGRNRVCLA